MGDTTVGELDPRSEGYEWPDHRGPFTALSADDVAAYDRDGSFVLRGALSPETVAAVLDEIDPIEAAVEDALRDQGGSFFIARVDEITFTTHLAKESDVLAAFVSSEPFLGLVADLIGPDVRLYWDQAVYKKPDTEAHFPWHQDNGYAFIEPQAYLTCWIPLTDADEQNGCPLVLPGVHRRGTLRHRLEPWGLQCLDDPTGAVPVPVQAGDIVVFSSLTPHTTGPNRTDAVRKSYIVQYAPEGAGVLSTSPDGATVRTLADDPDRQFPVLVGGQAVPRA